MKKSQMLQLVEDFLPSGVTVEMFYSLNLWDDNQVTLQGKFNGAIIVAFTHILTFSFTNPNGYAVAETTLYSDEGQGVRVTITLT